jgi:lipopolysaccharide export system protein LptA
MQLTKQFKKLLGRYLKIILAFAPLSVPVAHALPGDHQQPISIESDRAQRNDKTGLTIYEGAVNMIQGTINIKADKITVYSTQDKVNKIVCIGTPAHYQQQSEPGGGLVTARANTIEYQLVKDVIKLVTNASLSQEGSTLKGEIINYDLKAELVEARGDITGKKRIQMVIPPSQQQDQQAKPVQKEIE